MSFVEVRPVPTLPCPVNLDNLLDPLPQAEFWVLLYATEIYRGGDPGTSIHQVLREIDRLGDLMLNEGYEPSVPIWWVPIMQDYIEWNAHYEVGRDRLAIALGYLRDAFVNSDVQDLRESRAQFKALYDMLAPMPFEY